MTVSVLCFDEIKSCAINFKRENQLPACKTTSGAGKLRAKNAALRAFCQKKTLSNDDNPSDSKLKLRKRKLDFT